MHHYTLITCHTLPRAAEVLHIWQSTVVKLAFTHGPLLHQILAFSAFHMAYVNPDQRHDYSVLALQHQNEAARGLRTYLTHINAENQEACFAAACFLIFGAFARLSLSSTGGEDSPQPTLLDLTNVFAFIRGMNVVLQESENTMQQGCLADLFRLPVYMEPVSSLQEICNHLEELRSRLRHNIVDSGADITHIIEGAIFKLVKSTQNAARTASTPELRALVVWPIVLSDEFLALFQERHPLALVVIAYYCVIIHNSQSTAWFTRGWGTSVASDINGLLSPSYRALCEWALHRIIDG
ncbi:hypothetical protein jhhlp_005395 [Lomentospora prolificans]|uniref:Transcription factor domain-containing protein n=1 Tax=Lomentospora prolificans TaxID=41688 RepID=A0A2N3N6P5_9PEZI|nr:hypothetical protein jhhlp_005395 [Lomentospora prolificans]